MHHWLVQSVISDPPCQQVCCSLNAGQPRAIMEPGTNIAFVSFLILVVMESAVKLLLLIETPQDFQGMKCSEVISYPSPASL